MNRRLLTASISVGLLIISSLLPRAASADGPVVRVTQIDQSDFPRIRAFLSITDAQGQAVRDLRGATFRVTENGQEVEADFEGGVGCMSVALAVDRSGSMGGGKLDAAIRAASTFVELLQPCDKAAVVAFDDKVEVLQGITSDKGELARGIRSITIRGSTAFYDAAAQGVDLLTKAVGRRAVVALTDGMDNRSKRSKSSLTDLALKRGVSIYTVGLGRVGADIDEGSLREVASKSGGSYLHAPEPSQLGHLYQAISEQMRSEYQISYVSPRPVQDGTRRDVEVRLDLPGGQSTASGAYLVGGVLPAVGVDWPTFLAILLPLLLLLWPGGVPALLEGKYRGGLRPTAKENLVDPAHVDTALGKGVAARDAERHEVDEGMGTVLPAASRRNTSALIMFPVTKSPVTLGRDSRNDVVLNDASVESEHAKLSFESNRYVVSAQSQRSRILVNFSGQPGQEKTLVGKNAIKDGSQIVLGTVACTLKTDPSRLIVEFLIPQGGLKIGHGSTNQVIVNGDGDGGVQAVLTFEAERWTVRGMGGPVYVSFSGVPSQERLVTGRNAVKSGSIVRIGNISITLSL